MDSSTDAIQANEEQYPCLSSAERDNNQVIDDSSGAAHTFPEANISLKEQTLGRKVSGQDLNLAEPIPRSLTTSWVSILADTISILSTVPFLVLASLLARGDGNAVDQSSQRDFENSIKVAATALPIIFASVFGRLTTQVARWRLERGGSLSSIEQWLGSRTVSSAFLTQFQLGGFNIIGATMGITWALSPLGAQAVLRIFGTRNMDIVAETSVLYFDTNTLSWFKELGTTSASPLGSDNPNLIDAIYTAALLSLDSTKSDNQDSWGNIKIPYLDISSHAQSSPGTWIPVPNDETIRFSSLLGLPAVITPQSSHRVKFTMESSYMQLECSPFVPTAVGGDDLLDTDYPSLYNNESLLDASSGASTLTRVDNRTWQAITSWTMADPWVLAMDTFIDPLWYERLMQDGDWSTAFVNETGIDTTQARLQLLTWELNYNIATYSPRATTCWVSQPYIESEVVCTWSGSSVGRTCAVVAQRPSQKPHASMNITSLSFQAIFAQFSRLIPKASGLQYSYGLTDASILYLINTSSSFLLDSSSRTSGVLSTIPADDIGSRLGQLLNTYQISSQAFESVTSGIPNEYVDNITAAAQTTSIEEVYAINKPWLAVFFITALVMLIGSVIGAVFCHISHTPEILGFASSAIRDSKYVNLAPGFGALGGLEMTKAFEGIEFRYGVVDKQDGGRAVMGVSWKVNVERAKKGVA